VCSHKDLNLNGHALKFGTSLSSSLLHVLAACEQPPARASMQLLSALATVDGVSKAYAVTAAAYTAAARIVAAGDGAVAAALSQTVFTPVVMVVTCTHIAAHLHLPRTRSTSNFLCCLSSTKKIGIG
jgi:hypothetical protein